MGTVPLKPDEEQRFTIVANGRKVKIGDTVWVWKSERRLFKKIVFAIGGENGNDNQKIQCTDIGVDWAEEEAPATLYATYEEATQHVSK